MRRGRCVRSSAEDTVYALSSGRGVAGVAVIRISGPKAMGALEALSVSSVVPAARVACMRRLRDPRTEEILDEALVLRFEGPKSFTGEDVVELHCHGGVAVVDGVLSALGELGEGVRPADRGEFTRRAFAAGKLGLTEVEGLADLLLATTSSQRRQALSIMAGSLERRYAQWREDVASIRASAEAIVDFGDDVDGDVSTEEVMGPTVERIFLLRDDIRKAADGSERGEAVRDGVKVVLAGAPNAGKSSLLNAIAQRPAAIVSDTAGTTRDVLEVNLNLGSVPVRLFDTAGLRGATAVDPVEIEGIRRATHLITNAHVLCFVLDADDLSFDGLLSKEEEDDDRKTTSLIFVANKSDKVDETAVVNNCKQHLEDFLDKEKDLSEAEKRRFTEAPWVATTALETTDSSGCETLLAELEKIVASRFATHDEEAPAITRQRHRTHVLRCLEHLDRAADVISVAPELGAENLRLASLELGRVVGAIDVEDVLDHLFSDFCIGK